MQSFLPAEKDHTRQRAKHGDGCVGLNVVFLPGGNLNIAGHFAKNVTETFALFNILCHLFCVVSYATERSNLPGTNR